MAIGDQAEHFIYSFNSKGIADSDNGILFKLFYNLWKKSQLKRTHNFAFCDEMPSSFYFHFALINSSSLLIMRYVVKQMAVKLSQRCPQRERKTALLLIHTQKI